MDNKIEIFKNEQFGEVRTILEGEKVLFCAADVAKALGYTNPNKAVNDHCRAITKRSTPISGKVQSINFIPEGDVYRLIIRSKLPAAEKFELWVFDEVIPTIRKTGGYSTTLPDFANPAEAARAWADEYEKNLALTAANQQLTEEKEMLEIVIGNAREWKAVTTIPWLKHYFIDTSPRTCAAIGKFLTSCSRMRGAEIKKSPDSRWGEVNVYRTDIIDDMERLLDIDPNLLACYRK